MVKMGPTGGRPCCLFRLFMVPRAPAVGIAGGCTYSAVPPGRRCLAPRTSLTTQTILIASLPRVPLVFSLPQPLTVSSTLSSNTARSSGLFVLLPCQSRVSLGVDGTSFRLTSTFRPSSNINLSNADYCMRPSAIASCLSTASEVIARWRTSFADDLGTFYFPGSGGGGGGGGGVIWRDFC